MDGAVITLWWVKGGVGEGLVALFLLCEAEDALPE